MLEAAAAGLACVVCNVCGNVDFIRETDTARDGGLLVVPHDATALATALERLICDPPFRSGMGVRARQRARKFTWMRTAEHAEAAYRQALWVSGRSTQVRAPA